MNQDQEARGLAAFQALNPDAVATLQAALSDIAPDLFRYAVSFPFGEIYQRGGLSKRDRQIATVVCLATRGDAAAQLDVHIGIALKLGIAPEELAETFIQLIPYAGFPTAINATLALRAHVAKNSETTTV